MSNKEKDMKIPTGAGALTAVWLTNALRTSNTIREATVTAFAVDPLGDEQGITGQLARVRLTYDKQETGAPQSLIAKFPATDAETRNIFRSHYLREVGFYQELAPKTKLRTPHCYYSSLDVDTLDYVLLLEDLAPARSGDWVAGCTLAEAELAIRQIAEFHATWWARPELTQMTWLLPPGLDSFAQAQASYKRQLRPFLDKMAGRIPDALLAIGERVGEQYITILQRVHGRPQTILHKDYQLGNLFFNAPASDSPLIVIDWQGITLGLGVFDVATFLGGNIAPHERRAKEMEFLKLYHAILVDNGVQNYSFEQCFEDYRFCMLYMVIRYVLVVGGDFLTPEQEAMFVKTIVPRYMAAVLDLKADEVLPR